VTTFYTKKDEVSLKSGQTLGYTAGKGYYAAGTPTPPKPPPSSTPAKTSPDKSTVAPTATRPTAAKTPTTPASLERAPTTSSRTADGDRAAAAASNRSAPPTPSKPVPPKIGESTPYYTKPGDVPLKPGQTLGHETGEGYYAIGRPNPTKASSKPESSTAKVMALSSRGSTESPLKEHIETRNGKTSITLSHATKPAGDKTPQERKVSAHANERSAKPHAATARAHTTRKASSRVDHELARTRERSPRAQVANGIHHLEKKGPGSTFEFNGPALLTAILLTRAKVDEHGDFLFGNYLVRVSFEASIKGPEITVEDGRLVLEWGGNTISSVKLDGVLDHFTNLFEEVNSHENQVQDLLEGTLPLAGGGTVTTSVHPGISVTVTSHGLSTTVGLKPPDTFYVTTSGSKRIQLHPPLVPVDIDVDATVEFTPLNEPESNPKPTTTREREVTPKGRLGYTTVFPGTISIGPSVGSGEGIVALGNRRVGLGTGGRARDAMIGIGAAVNHGDVSMGSKVTE
jgi:hypothetical protein